VARAVSAIWSQQVWPCVGVLLLVCASAESSHAAASQGQSRGSPTKAECLEAHKASQQAQNGGRLVEARALAMNCTSPTCPGLLVADCAGWLKELDQRIPSVVFDIRAQGRPSSEAEVYADDKRVENWTRGEALRLDPGEHRFRFTLAPFAPSSQTVVLGEGMRYRVVTVDFATAQAMSPGQTVPDRTTVPSRPIPVLAYPLLGLGVVGLGGFIGLGLSGKAEQRHLERTCSPNCTDADLSTMKSRYLVADISLAVGVGSLVGAAILYVFRPPRPPAESVGLTLLPGGGSMAFLGRRF
jgi:hypothetical protein